MYRFHRNIMRTQKIFWVGPNNQNISTTINFLFLTQQTRKKKECKEASINLLNFLHCKHLRKWQSVDNHMLRKAQLFGAYSCHQKIKIYRFELEDQNYNDIKSLIPTNCCLFILIYYHMLMQISTLHVIIHSYHPCSLYYLLVF